ncbi:MAG: hypothetical protein VX899_06455 [Myxococcota bacterium]|nr:hypothetical protein [Myxococcota bacterium]
MSQRIDSPSSPETLQSDEAAQSLEKEPQAPPPPEVPGCYTRDIELPEEKRGPPVQNPEVPGAYTRSPERRKSKVSGRHGLEGPPPGCGLSGGSWW